MIHILSVIIPVYNEATIIEQMIDAVETVLESEKIEMEIIVVDDGSDDRTWDIVKEISITRSTVKGIGFTRNFGKEAAIFAGLSESKGDCAVVIDGDLQHPPEKIIEMYRLWQNGYEIVEGRKNMYKEERYFYSAFSTLFYRLVSNSVGVDMNRSSDFKMLDRKVVLTLLNMPERNAFFRALSSWTGYKTTEVKYFVGKRSEGKTKWSTWGLIKYAFTNISSFSSAPMQIVTILGVIVFMASLALSVITLVQKIRGISMEGFTTVIIMQGFTGSIIMISLGIIGYYISKIYDEIKHRPRYIIGKRTNGAVSETNNTNNMPVGNGLMVRH